jgi:hypothetical protein
MIKLLGSERGEARKSALIQIWCAVGLRPVILENVSFANGDLPGLHPAKEAQPDKNHTEHACQALRWVIDAASSCKNSNLAINFARG